MVTIFSGGANGSSSRNRQTPLKHSGSWRRAHFCSNSAQATRGRRAVPVVGHVEQVAALGAGGEHPLDLVRGRTVGLDALLEGEIVERHDCNVLRRWNFRKRESLRQSKSRRETRQAKRAASAGARSEEKRGNNGVMRGRTGGCDSTRTVAS